MITEKRRRERERSFNRAFVLSKLMLPQSLIKVGYTPEMLLQDRIKWARHMQQNRKNCSCAMCCNPRRSPFNKGSHKKTMQERKADIDLKDSLVDVVD